MNLRIQNNNRVFHLFIFITCSLFVRFASADQLEATCWDGSCFTSGWSIKGDQLTDAIENKCREGDCSRHGWYVAQFGGKQYYTQCMSGGCFKEGYWLIEMYTQKLVETIRCEGPSVDMACFRYGWSVSAPAGNRYVECIQDDCMQYGWQSFGVSGEFERIQCVKNDCTRFGWSIER